VKGRVGKIKSVDKESETVTLEGINLVSLLLQILLGQCCSQWKHHIPQQPTNYHH